MYFPPPATRPHVLRRAVSAHRTELDHDPSFTLALLRNGIKAQPVGFGGIKCDMNPTCVSISEKSGFYIFRPRSFDLDLVRPCTTFSLGPRRDPTGSKKG